MKNFKQIVEAIKPNTVVVFFGRCNPPTVGHLIAFTATVQMAKKLKADYSIVVSRTQDKKSNPLSLSQKLEYLNILFPGIKFSGASDSMRTPIEVLKQLNKSYKNIVFIAGSDRVPAFEELFNKYNGTEYKYDSIKVVSAGERDPDSDSASGMSATKMRKAALDNDVTSFKKGLLPHVRDIDVKRLMNDIRVGLGQPQIKESIKLNTTDIREKYRAGEIFAEGSFVAENAVVYKIINRNNNYLTLVNESGIISKKWLTDVQECTPGDDVINKFGEITEMKFSSSDKIKVAKIIGGMLGADVEKSSNPEQIVNAGLKCAKSKAMNDESISILKKMLQTADDAGIKYDATLIPSSVKAKNESLPADAEAGDYIGDFTKSKAPQFKGKSKEKRKQMALAAYYSAKRNESLDELNQEPMDTLHSADVIHAKVEQAHVSGKRHITEDPKHQVIADRHHLSLNQMGGKQVAVPHGAAMGASVDTGLGRQKVMKQVRGEAVEVDPSDDYKFSDEDIDKIVDTFKDENDILPAYEDDELHFVDGETGESQGTLVGSPKRPVAAVDEVPDAEKDMYDMETKYVKDFSGYESVEAMNEVLTRQDRIKAGIRMRIHHQGMERKIHLALQRHSNTKTLAHRAKKLAISAMKAKMLHKPVSQFSVQDKERAEKMLAGRRDVLNRITLKLIPRVRKIEQTRLSHPTFTQPSASK